MSKTKRLYELRTYYANEGKLDDLIARFRNHTIRKFEEHNMRFEGIWIPQENPERKVMYMLSFPDTAAMEQSWANFKNDTEWQALKAASNSQGELVGRVDSVFMEATDFSPLR